VTDVSQPSNYAMNDHRQRLIGITPVFYLK